MMRRSDYLLVFLGALLLALSRLPLNLGWLVFIGWIPFLMVFERCNCRPRQLLWVAAIKAVVYILVVMYWIGAVTPPGLIGIVLVYTGFYFIAFYAIYRIYALLPKLRYMGFVAVLISFEYVQNFGETRFPWFNQAYSLADYTILIQLADLGGVVLLSLLCLLFNVLIYRLLAHKRRLQPLVIIILLLGLWLGYGHYCLRYKPLEKHEAQIHVMQPSIEQDLKWDEEQYYRSMALFQELTLKAVEDSARLVIWPEGAVTRYLRHDLQAQLDLKAILDTVKVDIFTGFPHFEPAPPGHRNQELYYNAATLVRPGPVFGELYFKNILVPMGERTLWLDTFPFLWVLNFQQANWEFGTKLEYFQSGNLEFSPSICYELAFPEIHHRMAIPWDGLQHRYRKCDYLVNITNDAWFGTSYGPWLHAMMAKFRAVENRIQIYRSANTGISLVVDPKGRILAQTRLFEVTNITAPLYTSPEITLQRRIHRWPMLVLAFALLITLLSCVKTMPRRS